MCMIDDEETLVPGIMRDSGDCGYISATSGKLYYIGRTDRQIKRHGIRVNLDHIQQVMFRILNTVYSNVSSDNIQ